MFLFYFNYITVIQSTHLTSYMNNVTCAVSKILLLCDNALVVEGIKALFERTPDLELTRTVATCEKATQRINADSPEIILLSMNDSITEVAGMVECIRDKNYSGKIILLMSSLAQGPAEIAMNLDKEVEGIILNTATTREFERCVQRVRNGEKYISRDWLSVIRGERSGTREDVYCSMLLSGLSDTEKAILKLIAQKKTTNEIADKLFNSPKTIENHRYRICRKLNLNGKNSLLTFVIENKNCFQDN